MVLDISNEFINPRRLSQSVLQICEILGMYQAELARILRLQCRDIGRLSSGKAVLEKGTESWQQAEFFLEFYRLLYLFHDGNEVAMCNWLRKDNPELGGAPLLQMVDELRVSDVISYLKDAVQT